MSWPESQVQAINVSPPKSWKDFREGCLSTYAGGHHDDGHLGAFQHGMETVFNLLEAEFPPAKDCKAAPLYKAAVEAMVLWFDAENQNLGSFHEKMDLCAYAEWTARRAMGQDVGDFKGVPRLVLTIGQPDEDPAVPG